MVSTVEVTNSLKVLPVNFKILPTYFELLYIKIVDSSKAPKIRMAMWIKLFAKNFALGSIVRKGVLTKIQKIYKREKFIKKGEEPKGSPAIKKTVKKVTLSPFGDPPPNG